MDKCGWLMAVCIAGCLVVDGAVVRISHSDSVYARAIKPTWMPPAWICGVLMVAMSVLKGVALSIVLGKGWHAGGVKRASTAFVISLALHSMWSLAFFGHQTIGGAMVLVVALWLAVSWAVATFWSVRDVAGVLLLPVWVWVTFAVGLNAAVWRQMS